MLDTQGNRTIGDNGTADPSDSNRPIGRDAGDELRDSLGISPAEESAMDDGAVADSGTLHPVSQVYDPEPENTPNNSSRGNSSKSELSDTDLTDAENAADQPTPSRGEARESQLLGTGKDDKNEGNFITKSLRPKAKQTASKKYVVLGAGLGGAGIVVVAAIALVMLIGPLKNIHFETVLRSVGFAAFQRTMGKAYAQVVFDNAVLTDGSEARLRGNSTGYSASRLKQLGLENKLRWNVSASGKVTGLEINGRQFSLDESAKSLGLGDDFGKLSTSDKWRVRSHFNNRVRSGLTEILADKNLVYRTSVYNSVRVKAGISMWRWPDKARAYLGENPRAARILNLADLRERVRLKLASIMPGRAMSEDAQAQADEAKAIQEAGGSTRSVKPSETITKLNSGALKVSLVSTALTLMCLIHEIDQAMTTGMAETELSALRLAHDAQSTSDQITSEDTVAEASNAENERWYDAASSCAYRQDSGETLGPDCQEEVASIPPIFANTPFMTFVMAADNYIHTGTFPVQVGNITEAIGPMGINPFETLFINMAPSFLQDARNNVQESIATAGCSVVLNEFVQWGIAVAEIGVSLGSAFVVNGIKEAIWVGLKNLSGLGSSMLFGQWLGKIIDAQIKQVSGYNYTGEATGADAYNQTRVATSYLAATGSRLHTFGRPLTVDESRSSQAVATREMREEYNSKGFSERYFAITNPYSLLGQTVARMPTTMPALLANVSSFLGFATSILSSPAKLASSLSGVVSSRVFAAEGDEAVAVTPFTAGVLDWGYSEAELEKIRTDPSFETSALTAWIEPQLDALNAKYMNCYLEAEPLQSDIVKAHPECITDTELLASDEALHWRWYHSLQSAQKLINTELSAYETAQTAGAAATVGTGTGTGTGAVGNGQWSHPTGGNTSHGWTYYSTSSYGMPPDGRHGGIDFKVGEATVYAACSGTVKIISRGARNAKPGTNVPGEWTKSNMVSIACDSSYGPYEVGYHHTYASDGLTVGAAINAGDVVGVTDNSGNSFGAHLHFTLKDTTQLNNGYYGFIDPVSVIPGLY